MSTMDYILVFKTNIENTRHIKKIEPALNVHPLIKEWNVDLQDCEKILSVVTEMAASEIECIVLNAGYTCEELK